MTSWANARQVSVIPAALMRQLRDAMGSEDELSPTPPRKLLRRAAKGGFKHAMLNFVMQVTRHLHPSKRSSASARISSAK